MKLFLQKVVIRFLHSSGLNALCGYFFRDKIFVINYHSIGRLENKAEFSGELYENLSVMAHDFDEQIAFLKKHGHTFVTFTDLPHILKSQPKKPTLIYFDDGFKDDLVNALPILKKYGVPATVFVSTGLIDRTHFLWTLKYRYFLRKSGVALSNDIEKEIARLKSLSAVEREKYLAEAYNATKFIFDANVFDVFLDWDDLRELAKNGWEIGTHGVAHRMLTECGPGEMRAEIFDSHSMIIGKIGTNVESFSFPHGRFSDAAIDVLHEGGYRYAVSSGAGVNDPMALGDGFCFLRTIGVRPADRLPDLAFRLYAKNLIKRLL